MFLTADLLTTGMYFRSVIKTGPYVPLGVLFLGSRATGREFMLLCSGVIFENLTLEVKHVKGQR